MRGEPTPKDDGRSFWLGLGLIELLGLALALVVAPALVNGDGLGYLKASVEPGPPYPGHLGYLPLLRAVARMLGAGDLPIDRLWAGRLISLAGGVITSTVLGLWARRLDGDRAGWLAAAGIWASAGALGTFADVETYGIALAAVTVALHGATSTRWLGNLVAVVAATASVLFHVENVLLLVPLGLLLPARRRPLVAVALALVAAAYAWVLVSHRLGLGWLVGAGHGYVQTQRWLIPIKAIYGAGKALVYAPYLYEAGWLTVLVSSALGIGALGSLLWRWRRPVPLPAMLAWLVPYALVGAAFFGSDAERWLFLLPLLWLGAVHRRRLAALVVVILVLADLVLLLPTARDHRARDRALAASTLVADGDLVISPGHGWDEYLGFVARRRTVALPLVYHAALHGTDHLAATVAAEVAAARAAGHRVLLVRLSHDDDDPLGWKELLPLGIDRHNVDGFLPHGTRVRLGPDVEELR